MPESSTSDQTRFDRRVQGALSRVTLLFALAAFVLVGCYLPYCCDRTSAVFRDFQIGLPQSTSLLLRVPGAVFTIVAGLAAIGAIVIQVKTRPGTAAMFHLTIAVIFLVIFLGCREILSQPLYQSMQTVSGTSK